VLPPQILAASFNGTGWSSNDVPNPSGASDAFFYGVACPLAADCMAVGGQDSPPTPLIETWNGTTWTVVPAPGTNAYLDGVSCLSPSACIAVGGDPALKAGLLSEEWNGTTWSQVAIPLPPKATTESLRDLTCVSTSSCWAVGYFTTAASNLIHLTLIEHWNGSSWTVVPSPNPA
jgi:hypothetical protein